MTDADNPPDQSPLGSLSGTERLIISLLNDLLSATLADVNCVIANVLARLGTECGFDRTYVFRLSPDGAFIDNTDEWVADGVAPMRHLFRRNPQATAPLWQRLLAQDGPLLIGDAWEMAAEDPGRAVLAAGDIRSALLVPIRDGVRISGLLGFDSVAVPRPITSDEIFVFKAVASGIAALLLRTGVEHAAAEARAALEQSHSRLQATLAAMPDLVLEMDSHGHFTAWHAASTGDMVAPPAAFLGKTIEDVLPPSVASIGRAAMRDVDATGRSAGHRYQLALPGGPSWFEMTAARRAPVSGDAGHGYVLIVRNITERMEALEQVHFRDVLMGGFFELSPVGMVLNEFETGAILDANPAFLGVSGHAKAELLTRGYADIMPPDALPEVQACMAELGRVGRYGPMETQYLHADGRPYPVVARGFLVEDPAGRRLVWSMVEDITTERTQRAALEARSAEAEAARRQLETAVEALRDGFALFDADDRLVLSNQRYRDLFPGAATLGPNPRFEAIIDCGIALGHYAPAIGREADYRAETLARHRLPEHETTLELADGRILWVVEKATSDGGRVGLQIDVTKNKQAEQHLSDVIKGAQVGTWEWDVQTDVNRVNDRWAEMLGYSRADLEPVTNKTWEGLIHPDDRQRSNTLLQRVFTRELEQFECLIRFRHAAGHWVWVQARGRVVRWLLDGRPGLMAGVHLDVSALREAEQRLEHIIDGTKVGTWTFDTERQLTLINDHWAEMLGYTATELVPLTTRKWEGLVHPDDLTALLAAEAAHFARGEWLVEHELRLRHKAGHWVWVLTRGRAIAWNAAGDPITTAGVNLDISSRKELEFALQRERDFLSRLMETSASGIVALDAEGQIIFANKEAETVLGRSLAQIEGRHHHAAEWAVTDLDGHPIPAPDMPFVKVITTQETLRDYRAAISWPDGSRHVISVNAAPLSAPGVAATVVCSVTDITLAVQAETALRVAMERAEAGNRAKSEFLANMSHEIRTPLNGVLGMAEVLGHTRLAPEQKAMLATIQQSGELLLTVINDILDLAKIEAGHTTLERLPFTPADLADRIEAMHGLVAQEKGIELTLLTDSGSGLKRLGDAQRVMQILHNLVGNGVKFTEQGEVRVVLWGRAGAPLVIDISDTGIGMTPEQVTRVFDPFTQADGTISRRFGGTGLGLPIVRQLVTLMGGTISIEAEPGRGTRVRVSLPLEMADPALSAPLIPAPLASVGPLRALVAEDNATNRFILRSMLANLGVSFTMVNDGDEAVDTWQPGLFDVLLLDISMPHKDGLTALDEINAKALSLGAKVPPALAVTANAMTHHVAQYSAAGFAACVAKPVRMDELAASIAQACRAA